MASWRSWTSRTWTRLRRIWCPPCSPRRTPTWGTSSRRVKCSMTTCSFPKKKRRPRKRNVLHHWHVLRVSTSSSFRARPRLWTKWPAACLWSAWKALTRWRKRKLYSKYIYVFFTTQIMNRLVLKNSDFLTGITCIRSNMFYI